MTDSFIFMIVISQEVDRTFFDKDLTTVKSNDAGFWLFNIDPNIPTYLPTFAETIPELNNAVDMDALSCKELYCGLPYYFPVRKLLRCTRFLV